jgi:hypothetical protein
MTDRWRRVPGVGETVCPYCGRIAPDPDFTDPADIEAAQREIAWAFERDVGEALKQMAADFNRRTPSRKLLTIRMDVKERPRARLIAWREDLLRSLVCGLCGRAYGVFAIALLSGLRRTKRGHPFRTGD